MTTRSILRYRVSPRPAVGPSGVLARSPGRVLQSHRGARRLRLAIDSHLRQRSYCFCRYRPDREVAPVVRPLVRFLRPRLIGRVTACIAGRASGMTQQFRIARGRPRWQARFATNVISACGLIRTLRPQHHVSRRAIDTAVESRHRGTSGTVACCSTVPGMPSAFALPLHPRPCRRVSILHPRAQRHRVVVLTHERCPALPSRVPSAVQIHVSYPPYQLANLRPRRKTAETCAIAVTRDRPSGISSSSVISERVGAREWLRSSAKRAHVSSSRSPPAGETSRTSDG